MASLRNVWPDDNDQDEEEGTLLPHAPGSGPLCEAPDGQITATLNARLVQRFTRPLAGDGSSERGDTDAVEVLSEAEARILRRYLAAPTPAWMAQPTTAALPPLPDLADPTHPPRPLRSVAAYAPVQSRASVAVASRPQPAPALVDAAAVQAPVYPSPYQPISITRLVLRDFHISLHDGLLPPNVLALLDTTARRIHLAPALAPLIAARGAWGNYTERLERTIEARPISRLILAALYARWHSRMPSGVPDAACYVAAFAPAATSGLMRHEWCDWHGPLYTRLYAQTCRLISPITGQLSATYLGLRGGGAWNHYGMPRPGAELRTAVARRALTVVPALRAECATAQEMSERAWVHYVTWCARNLGVPRCVARDRLDGDRRVIRTPDDLCRWTDDILADAPEMGEWRAQVARAFGLQAETRRDGRYVTAAQRVALWCAEPSSSVA